MSELKSNFNLLYGKEALKIYDIINVSDNWDFSNISTFKEFIPVVNSIKDFGIQVDKVKNYKDFKNCIKSDPILKYDNKKVCIAFSGGLDSVYQSLYLREQGHEVHLLHISNLNTYTNGQELKVTKEFAEKFNFPLELVEFHKSGKKIWQENPFKDFLIYSICIDWCMKNKCSNISSGDDLRLSIKDSVFETNISDSKELTLNFFKEFSNITFIPINKDITKDKRLDYLEKFNARDYYNSCVGPGRLTQYLHNLNEQKYNVKVDKWNCASCRKCCSHVWYDYVFNNKTYSEDFLEKCWNKMSIGADANFFKNKKTFEERKKALLDY